MVDADFRAAVAKRQGPKGITDAPGGGPKSPMGPTGLAGDASMAGAGSVPGPQFARATPMLGAEAGGSGAGLGLLALLLLGGGL